ncbi:hypothetical protein L6452_20338 [Arctium lappa]|uniref:Uncharacterized protein n=1 Tax=Arctium lappa TaxID=4217 RepID=A0ACB9BBY6_ARCLA|nr:hypothetical protein L6452_20338 [Arctium lappa]
MIEQNLEIGTILMNTILKYLYMIEPFHLGLCLNFVTTCGIRMDLIVICFCSGGCEFWINIIVLVFLKVGSVVAFGVEV